LADWAEVYLVAPCTANVLAKLAHGIADDLLTCAALACAAPLIVAPAMNERMWLHAATQANVRTLRERGVRCVDVASGELACGVQGCGRLAPVEAIMAALREALGETR
jgi:phosphopantothenoylcysteine synthetase/decarboxylase